jgi:hypothetical protein
VSCCSWSSGWSPKVATHVGVCANWRKTFGICAQRCAANHRNRPGKGLDPACPIKNQCHGATRIDHESVSGRHCEPELAGGSILVRDLGSAVGTWVDTVQVDEAHLGAGQTLQVGEVQFALQLPVRVGTEPAGAAPVHVGESRSSVAAEPPRSASVYCGACNHWLELGETQRQRVGPASSISVPSAAVSAPQAQ